MDRNHCHNNMSFTGVSGRIYNIKFATEIGRIFFDSCNSSILDKLVSENVCLDGYFAEKRYSERVSKRCGSSFAASYSVV